MFISKKQEFSGENKKILLQSGKGIPKSLWWKIEATFLISFFFGGWGEGEGRGGEGMLGILQYFWGRLRRTCFPAKFYLFYEIKKLKEEKEREKKYIRSLKMCLLFLKKYSTWDQWFFFWIFLQFLNLKNRILKYSKDRIYVEIAQIRQNLII